MIDTEVREQKANCLKDFATFCPGSNDDGETACHQTLSIKKKKPLEISSIGFYLQLCISSRLEIPKNVSLFPS